MNIIKNKVDKLDIIALLLIFTAGFGLVISFLRDRIFAHFFGAGAELDLYFASFKIPEISFLLLFSMLTFAVIGSFFEKWRNVELKNFINTIFYFILIFSIIIGLIIFFIIPYIAPLMFPTFSEETLKTFIGLNRIIILSQIFLIISLYFSSILQFKRKFLFFAFLGIIYNLSILLSTFFFQDNIGIWSAAIGTLIGSFLMFSIQIPSLYKNNLLPALYPKRGILKEIKALFITSFPDVINKMSFQLSYLFLTIFFISIGESLLSIFTFADQVAKIPYQLIAISFITAGLPLIASLKANNNKEGLGEEVLKIFRKTYWFLLPVVAFIFLYKEVIIKILFETGKFTSDITIITSDILGILLIFSIALAFTTISTKILFIYGKGFVSSLIIIVSTILKFLGILICVVFYEKIIGLFDIFNKYFYFTEEKYFFLVLLSIIIIIAEVISAVSLVIIVLKYTKIQIVKIFKEFLPATLAMFAYVLVSVILQKLFGLTERLLTKVFSIENILIYLLCSVVNIFVWYIVLKILKDKEIEKIDFFFKEKYNKIKSLWIK